ncbi:hypothetical protein FRB99_007431 [Tulasnella sp. 403]|nr:hypothetical protein FRB99_007431 [Tulasnella sp. 403]
MRLPQGASINNSLLVTNTDLTPSTTSTAIGPSGATLEPRLFVSNNDESVKVFNISTSGTSRGRIIPAGTLKVRTPVNHTSISPDGKTLLAVGDTNEVFLYNVSAGNMVTFDKISTYTSGEDANFSTAWSSDGRRFAVACQDGSVSVWDTRSSHPLAIFRSGMQPPNQSSSTGGGRLLGMSIRVANRGPPRSGYFPPSRTTETSTSAADLARQARLQELVGLYERERAASGYEYRYSASTAGYPAMSFRAYPEDDWSRTGTTLESRAAEEQLYALARSSQDRSRISALEERLLAQRRRNTGTPTTISYHDLANYPTGSSRTPDGRDNDRSSPLVVPPGALTLPPPDVVQSWPERHPTVISYGEPGRGKGSWTEIVEGTAHADEPRRAAMSGTRNAARVLKFSPVADSRELLVFTEDSTRFHAIDAQTFNDHIVVTVPPPSLHTSSSTSGSGTGDTTHPRLSSRPSQTQANASDDTDMDLDTPPSTSFPAAPWSPSYNRACPPGPPHITGLSFDPTGGWIYVGTEYGVFEWEIEQGVRGWENGYVNWA